MPSAPRRFPPPWTVEELDACFVVIDSAEQKLAYVYFEGRARAQISRQAAQQRRSEKDRCEPREVARATNGATSLALGERQGRSHPKAGRAPAILHRSVQIRETNDQKDARRKKQNFGSGCDNSEQHEQLHRPRLSLPIKV